LGLKVPVDQPGLGARDSLAADREYGDEAAGLHNVHPHRIRFHILVVAVVSYHIQTALDHLGLVLQPNNQRAQPPC
jgi:hypothetical protein